MSLRGLALSFAGALLCACQGTKTYEGTHYLVTVDSEPTGGELFVLKREAWAGIAPEGLIPNRDVLLDNDVLVSAQGETKTSPHTTRVIELKLPERELVLVVLHADGKGFLQVTPTRDGEQFLVRVR